MGREVSDPDGMHFSTARRWKSRSCPVPGRVRLLRCRSCLASRADLAGGNRSLRSRVPNRRAAQARSAAPDDQLGSCYRGVIRRHVNVVTGASRHAAVTEATAFCLPSITGGSRMKELLVGTRKGLFVLRGDGPEAFEIVTRAFAGDVVEYAMRDARSGRYFASVTSGFYGPRLMWTEDPAGEWEHAPTLAMPADTDATLERTWVVRTGEAPGQLWAGVAPAALFESRDDGSTWELNRGLWDQPSRPDWNPGNGGLCSLICTWPGDPRCVCRSASARSVPGTRSTAARPDPPARRGSEPSIRPRMSPIPPGATVSTTCGDRPRCLSACSCSSMVASTAATTPAARGSTSRPACRAISASRSSATR